MSDCAVQSAAAAVMESHLRRLQQSPAEHADFWKGQVERYATLSRLSQQNQAVCWIDPNAATHRSIKTEPLGHLPSVTHASVQPAGICRFSFVGEMAFRDNPETIAKKARGARYIELVIDTAGGDSRWGMHFAGLIRSLNVPITATATRAYSAGAILFQCAHRRRIKADGSVMLHAPALAILGNVAELQNAIARLRETESDIIGLLELTTCRDRQQIITWLARDSYFAAPEAIAAGLADEIIP
jgi:ATP-dependent protease ClpP protease subunit